MEIKNTIYEAQRNATTSDVELLAKTVSTVPISPERLAEAFWLMDDEHQAVFFNRLAEIVVRLPTQLQAVTDCPILSPEARRVMEQIGEYARTE